MPQDSENIRSPISSNDTAKSKRKYALSAEQAASQYEEFLELYDIVVEELPTEKDRAAFTSGGSKLQRAIRRGDVDIAIDGCSVRITHILRQSPRIQKTQIVYHGISNTMKAAADGVARTADYARLCRIMGASCKEGPSFIMKLEGIDSSICELIAMVFMKV